jgi:hypothetical protein
MINGEYQCVVNFVSKNEEDDLFSAFLPYAPYFEIGQEISLCVTVEGNKDKWRDDMEIDKTFKIIKISHRFEERYFITANRYYYITVEVEPIK